jgi:hypothetical protein
MFFQHPPLVLHFMRIMRRNSQELGSKMERDFCLDVKFKYKQAKLNTSYLFISYNPRFPRTWTTNILDFKMYEHSNEISTECVT